MLPSWVSSCDIDGRTIFLDVRRNRYAAMGSDIAAALKTGDYAAVPPKILKHIGAWGWQDSEGEEPPRGGRLIEKPNIELSAMTRFEGAPIRLVGSALASLLLTRCRLTTESFEALLRRVEAANDSAARLSPRTTPGQIVAASEMVDRVLSGSRACLVRSLALHRLLAHHGHASALVFAARLNPFRAHCWLQQGQVVLNDTIEQTGLFTALRVIE